MTAVSIKDGSTSASLYGNKNIILRSLSKLGKEFLDKMAVKAIVTKNEDLQEFSKLIHEATEKNPSLWSSLGMKIFASNFRPVIDDDKSLSFEDKILKHSNAIAVGTGIVSGIGYLLTSTSVDMGIVNMIGTSIAMGTVLGLVGGIVVAGSAIATGELFEITAGVGIAHYAKNMINKMPDEEKEKVRSTVLKLWTEGQKYSAQDQEIFMQQLDKIIPMNEPNKSLAMKP